MGLFKKRAYAYIIDFFVVSAFMWILAYIAYFAINYFNMFGVYQYAIFILPFIIILYFTIMEGSIGATVGKRLMFIQVVSPLRGYRYRYGKISYTQAFIRSLSKIFWLPIILDILLGKLSGNVRILDKLSRTIVVEERVDTRYSRNRRNF
ncbi:MAG: RDD family protein [archaeon]|nr:RDD family protein [archaeon]